MKRTRTGNSDALVSSSKGEQGFWPSYADMMSAVALILFFLMLLSYIQNLITGNDLQSTQDVLRDTREALALTQSEVDEARNSLALITEELDSAQLQLLAQQDTIASQDAKIGEQEALIGSQEALIGDQKSLLTELENLTDEQAKYLAATDEEIKELRGQMQTIAVLRLSILNQIKDSLEKVMGRGTVSIGDNGSIVLSESVLFDLGSSAIKNDSRPMLNQLAEVFADFLSDGENAKYVDSIVISGHTDSSGGADYNRTLSTDRANSVLGYLLTAKNGALDKYAGYFCAAGYGATRPVANNSTDVGRAANRRIEISIILKDETVLEIVEDYLAIEPPASGSGSTSPKR